MARSIDLFSSLRSNNHSIAVKLRWGSTSAASKAKLGPAGAITATVRKIATVFYTLVSRQVEFDNSSRQASDAERRVRR